MTTQASREHRAGGRWIITEVEVAPAAFDPAIDGPSNAQVLCAGLGRRRTLLVVLAVDIAWMLGQVAARRVLATCFDAPPFVILQRANLVLAIAVVTLAIRARIDARERQEARRLRAQLRLAKAEEVRAAIERELVDRLSRSQGSLH